MDPSTLNDMPGRVRMTLLLATVCVFIAGCAGSMLYSFAPEKSEFERLDRFGASMRGESSQRPLLFASLDDQRREVPPAQRIVIYNAGFRIVVPSVDEAIKQMERIADQRGGYVQQIKGDQITIRVPVQQYQSAVAAVEALGTVAERQLDAIDVTEEFVDLEARLRNAINVRKRLEALLEKAENVEAALAVEKELNRVNEEIERLQAKLELIKNRVAYSTISATFERVARQTEIVKGYQKLPFRWLQQLDPNRLWMQ